jgi:hypothetical protein
MKQAGKTDATRRKGTGRTKGTTHKKATTGPPSLDVWEPRQSMSTAGRPAPAVDVIEMTAVEVLAVEPAP